MLHTLRDALKDWTDFDVAALHLAHCLGIMGSEVPAVHAAKSVFWSANAVGDSLSQMLDQLVSIGALQFDGNESRFRWNPSFDWERANAEPAVQRTGASRLVQIDIQTSVAAGSRR